METSTMKAMAGIPLAALLVALWGGLAGAAQASSPAYANFEAAQTNPIRLSADGARLFAVNTDNSSLSVFDVSTPTSPRLLVEIPVGLGPVSVNPLTDDEAWVVNQVSNSVSIVSVSEKIVTATLHVKPEPMDVVFAGPNAYITVSRANAIAVYNTSTLAPVAELAVFGGNPRALAVSQDGSKVYAAFALAGNGTTVVMPPIAPPQPAPLNPALPPPPVAALIVSATDPTYGKYVKYQMPANGVVSINTGASPSVAGYYAKVGTSNLGLAVNPVTGDIYVANTDALNTTFYVGTPYPGTTNLRGHWINNRITRIQVANGQITPFDLNPGINYSMLPNPAALSTALAQPYNIAFDPGGTFMWVAAFGTDRVARVDTNGKVLGFVEVSLPSGSGSHADPPNKRGPRGLALHATAHILYCLNRISNTISLISTVQNGSVLREIPVGSNSAPSTVTAGRGFLYDAKLSGNGTGACASCHIDADMDHLAWNLGNPDGTMTSLVQNGETVEFHPMKGPMTTLATRGLLNLAPYHWRGDQPNFAAFNPAFNDLMGNPAELTTAQMNAYTAFINTVLYLPNPFENLDRSLPPSVPGYGDAVQGEVDFMTLQLTTPNNSTCNQCHTANPGPGSNLRIDALLSQQPIKNVQLRNIYQKLLFDNVKGQQTIDGFGLDSDGHSAGLPGFFLDPIFKNYTATEKNDISAYMVCFDTGTAPAVGFTITLNQGNVSANQSNWSLLESQAGLANIDLIANGTLQGQVHALLYQPASRNYVSDTQVVYTHAQLLADIQGTDTLSFMGVYPGTGSAAIQRR
jgi:DNA-binding beta-propeller fold protein YncE